MAERYSLSDLGIAQEDLYIDENGDTCMKPDPCDFCPLQYEDCEHVWEYCPEWKKEMEK